MATPRKKKIETVVNEDYSKLEMYAIWMHEFYESLRAAGFDDLTAFAIILDKTSYPDWVEYGKTNPKDIIAHLEDEDETG